jgi:hypothetical protein
MSDMKNRTFVITGKVFSGSDKNAEHSLFWALRNSEFDGEIFIDEIKIEGDKNGKE